MPPQAARASPLGKLSPVRRLVTEEVKTSPVMAFSHDTLPKGEGLAAVPPNFLRQQVFAADLADIL